MTKRYPVSAIAVMMALCAVWAPQTRAAVPETVAGKVFLDANANGKLDAGEKGLAGVRVTDGVKFVATAADGSYTIKIDWADPTTPQKGSRVVAISWPGGMWPSGKWWARLDQITDATKVHFSLRNDEQKLPFAFLHVSDDHAAGATYKTIASATEKLKPLLRFCINTGDSGQSSLESDAPMAQLARNAANFVVPVMCVPGNHDIVGGHGDHRLDQHPLAGNGAHTKNLGPVRWSFDYAGVRFVGLDWMDPSIPKEVNGAVPRVAADWLEKDLQSVKPGTRIFLFVHFPTGCQKFYQVIGKYRVTHMFGGHNHRHRYYNIMGIPAVTAINFMAGGNLIVVQKDDFTPAEFCLGYKGPTHHSKRCSLAQFHRQYLPSLAARRGEPKPFPAKTLKGTVPISVDGAKSVQVSLEIQPGSATRAGVRIGAGDAAVEVVWTGDGLTVAGVPFNFGWEASDNKTLLWEIVVDNGRIEFHGNRRYHMGKAIKVETVGPVTFFAEGGEATVTKAQVWPLKAAEGK